MKWTDILFDLDGTLTDPGEGITNSIRYALEKMSCPVPGQKALEGFIGPPLNDSFRDVCGFDDDKCKEAIAAYREYFSDRGILENKLYGGIAQLLENQREKGARLYVATSKPYVFAVQILKHFDIEKHFTYVSGSTLEHVDHTKAEIVADVLAKNSIDPKNAVMVGDRRFDAEGAHQNDIPCIGVLFGYGGREELTLAKADYIAESVQHLAEILEQG